MSERPDILVVLVVGKSGVGKTTALELSSRESPASSICWKNIICCNGETGDDTHHL